MDKNQFKSLMLHDYPDEEIEEALQHTVFVDSDGDLEVPISELSPDTLDTFELYELAYLIEDEILDARERTWAKYKKCPTCGESKPVDHFSRNKSRHDGLQSECKVCAHRRRRPKQAAVTAPTLSPVKFTEYYRNPELRKYVQSQCRRHAKHRIDIQDEWKQEAWERIYQEAPGTIEEAKRVAYRAIHACYKSRRRMHGKDRLMMEL